jgi:hypothetical protein
MIFRGWFGHCQEIPRAVRCSPSLFHQLHFDWEATLSRSPKGQNQSESSARVGLLVKLFFARCLPSLFH